MIAAIEAGLPQREIEARAFEHQRATEKGERVIVGQNRFIDDAPSAADGGRDIRLHRSDPAIEARQRDRLATLRARRDASGVQAALAAVRAAARGTDNLLPFILQAVIQHATLGEISEVLRGVFGEHRPHA
jgi:methylmalonyl-CoA mutase, N-terminal domain